MGERRRRADLVLVDLGLFDSRARAQEAIAAGLVIADGVPVRKASEPLSEMAEIVATAPHPYVSRGGVKLAAALDAFGFDPKGLICLDAGASTGGFTDVLLRRGAAHVHAVDVGRGQLHPDIAADPRVTSLEGTDMRDGSVPIPAGSIDLAVVDVSFISLNLVLPKLMYFMKERAQLVALVKPQFEVGREGIGRGGIVRDAALRDASVARTSRLVEELGLGIVGLIPSPITGRDGNEEFLLGARRG